MTFFGGHFSNRVGVAILDHSGTNAEIGAFLDFDAGLPPRAVAVIAARQQRLRIRGRSCIGAQKLYGSQERRNEKFDILLSSINFFYSII